MTAVLDIGVTPARVAAPTLVAMERAVVAFATEMQRTLVPPLCYRGDCVEAAQTMAAPKPLLAN